MMDGLGSVIHELWRDIRYSGLWFWVPISTIFVALVWAYWRSKIEHWKFALLTILPLMWVFMGLWAGYLRTHYEGFHPDLSSPTELGLLLYPVCAVGLIAYLRGARLFAALFALLNLWPMVIAADTAIQAVTN
jgi:hypothetical protein